MKRTKKCADTLVKISIKEKLATKRRNKRCPSAGIFCTSSAGAVISLISRKKTIPITSTFSDVSRRRVTAATASITLFLILSVASAFCFSLLNNNAAYAYQISMDYSGAQSIDAALDSSGMGTSIAKDDISITTTCPTGYNLSISTSVNDNNLYLDGSASNNQSGKYFSPVDGVNSLASNTNKWGYYFNSNSATAPTGDSVFAAVPTPASPAIIKTPSTSTTSDSFSLYYGVSINSGLAAGTYKMVKESGSSTNDGTIVYYLTMDESCNARYMQDMTNDDMATLMPSEGDTVVLRDKRDDNDYSVAKINGQYWMTQNLRITNTTGQATGTILAEDSNFDSDLTFNGDLTAGNTYTAKRYHVPTASELSTFGLTAEQVGVYYNYCAATAGEVCSQTEITATKDICPSGWRLPNDDELSGITSNKSLFSPVGGGYYQNSVANNTDRGFWWSSSASTANNSGSLRYNTNLDVSAFVKNRGHYIRCVKKPDTATITVNFEGDVTSVTFSNATYGNQIVNNSGGTATLKTGVDYSVTMTYSSGTPTWRSVVGVLSSATTNPVTYSTNMADTLTASTLPILNVTFGTGIGGVIIKRGSPAGSTVATVTASGTTLLTGLAKGTQYYLLPLYSSGYTLNQTTATGGTVTSGTYGYYYYALNDGANTLNITASKLATSSSTVMQNLSSATCTAKPIPVKDNRDSAVYFIQRLADGKCWMLENLRLGSTSTTALTTSNTNITSNYTLPASGTANFTSSAGYTTAAINVASKTTTTTDYGPGRKYVGVYYNYCAASAGTYCYASGSGTGNASHDICPKGWRMPTDGSSGEYKALYTAYSSNATNFRNALSTPLSGSFDTGSAWSQGSYGYFWSSTRNGGSNMYFLYVNSSVVVPASDGSRYYGHSMRCLLDS